MVSITRKGYIELYYGDSLLSRHTAVEEAYERALAHLEENQDTEGYTGLYRVKYPERELDVTSLLIKSLPRPAQASWNLPDTISIDAGSSVPIRQYAVDASEWTISVTGLPAGLSYNSTTESIDAAAGADAVSGTATFTLSSSRPAVTTTTGVSLVAAADGDLSFVTVWGAPGDLSLNKTSSPYYHFFVGTDSITGQHFTDTLTGPDAQPKLWNGTWPDIRPPALSIYGAVGTNTGADYWDTSFVAVTDGPSGSGTDVVLRRRRKLEFSSPANPQCNIEITDTAPNATSETDARDMGMVYLRYHRRLKDFVSGNSGSGVLSGMKLASAGETSDRRITVGLQYDSGFGWLLRIQTSNSNSSDPGGIVWGDHPGDVLPRPWDSRYYVPASQTTAGQGEVIFYKGVFEDYTAAGNAPEPDWSRWATVVLAFRPESKGPRSWVAGNAAAGWIYVATALGTRTQAAPYSALKTRFYMPGPNFYDGRTVDLSNRRAGLFFASSHYGSAYPTNVDYDVGNLEIYDHWPADHPAGERPPAAI